MKKQKKKGEFNLEQKFFQESVVQELLQHYPQHTQNLLLHQINCLERMINEHKEKYVENDGFSEAFNIFIREVVDGSFIDFKENKEQELL